MSFPLADWIEGHEGLPHNLGSSGMKGSLATTLAILARPPECSEDPPALRAELADRLGVGPERVLLTHGASESNALALAYLAREVRRADGRAPTVHIPRPEYPPIVDAARFAGWTETSAHGADLLARSEPHNPTGRRAGREGLLERYGSAPRWLLDETFREFTAAPSLLTDGPKGLWATGTFTKVFGGDAVRVGWVVPAEPDLEGFRAFHGIVTDQVAPHCVALAREVLAHADPILTECRSLVAANLRTLRNALPDVGELSAPIAFDRPGTPDTRALGDRALSAGILTAPGHFFGDPSGIRLGLTRRSFPADLDAYLKVRAEFRT